MTAVAVFLLAWGGLVAGVAYEERDPWRFGIGCVAMGAGALLNGLF